MKDTIERLESGAVGQPGETTTSAGRTGQQANTLTSTGISSLLNSEFAKEDAASPPGQETPPAGETATDDHDRPAAGEERKEEGEEAKAEDGEQPKHEDAQTDESRLPEEMQTALEQWEAKGGPLPDALQHVVNKRIGRLTGEKAEAQKRAETAEAALKQAQAEAEALRNDPQRPAANFAGAVPDEQVLLKTERTAKQFLNEAEAYLDETATPAERTRVERFMESNQLDANGLKRHVRQINAFVRDELPAQKAQVQQFRAAEQQATAEARKQFPWLNDANAPEQATKAQMLKLLPDLPKRLPNHEMVLGIYMLGYKAYEAQLAKGAKAPDKTPPARTAPPKTPAGSATAQAATTRRRSASDSAGEAFSKAPTRDNAVNLARAALMEG
jgi:hypothetical protein